MRRDGDLRYAILETMRDHLAEWDVDPERVVEGAAYGADFDIDSLALETLAQALEDAYAIRLSSQDAAGLDTVSKTVDFVVAAIEAR